MARTTFRGLSRSMHRRSRDLPKQVSRLAMRVALVVTEDLTENTPVDTSKAISNWTVRLGSPISNPHPAYVEGVGGSTKEQSAKTVMVFAKFILSAKPPGRSIYISNTIDYISKLNSGSSQQEPAGFVERAVLVGRNKVKRSRLGL